jgi:hypothetical protein
MRLLRSEQPTQARRAPKKVAAAPKMVMKPTDELITLNTKKRDLRTMEQIQKDMDSAKRNRLS